MVKIIMEPSDYDDVRDEMLGVIDFVPDDALINFTLEHNPTILTDAAAWHWSDTEVRDRLAEALQDTKKMLDSPHG